MIRNIKLIVRFPFTLFDRIWNYIFLRVLFPFSGDEFPSISGRIIRSGKGLLSMGRAIKINSNATQNPVGIANRTMFYIAPKAQIIISDNVGISTSLFYAKEKITVEKDVLIGGGCQILDNDFHSIDYQCRVHQGDNNVKSAEILIKEGAFIGTRSIILKGVTIGKRSILAAGSVVSKSIPDDEIWGGNPAKFIKSTL